MKGEEFIILFLVCIFRLVMFLVGVIVWIVLDEGVFLLFCYSFFFCIGVCSIFCLVLKVLVRFMVWVKLGGVWSFIFKRIE